MGGRFLHLMNNENNYLKIVWWIDNSTKIIKKYLSLISRIKKKIVIPIYILTLLTNANY